MGHRANFVLIQNGTARAYEDQWAALGSTYQFADGPEVATFTAGEFSPTDELMEWAFAEAGYLLDYDQRIAIVFGFPEPMDEDFGLNEDELKEFGIEIENIEGMPEDVNNINVALEQGPLDFFKAIADKWQGWELRWDERGVDAFTEYLTTNNFKGIKTASPSSPDTEKTVVFYA